MDADKQTPELITEGHVCSGSCLRRLCLHPDLHLLFAANARVASYQEEGRPGAGRNLPAGSAQVVRVGGLEPPRHPHQETDRRMSEAAGQNR